MKPNYQKAKLQYHIGFVCGVDVNGFWVNPSVRVWLCDGRASIQPQSFRRHTASIVSDTKQVRWFKHFAKFWWNCTAGIALFKRKTLRRYCGWRIPRKRRKISLLIKCASTVNLHHCCLSFIHLLCSHQTSMNFNMFTLRSCYKKSVLNLIWGDQINAILAQFCLQSKRCQSPREV